MHAALLWTGAQCVRAHVRTHLSFNGKIEAQNREVIEGGAFEIKCTNDTSVLRFSIWAVYTQTHCALLEEITGEFFLGHNIESRRML